MVESIGTWFRDFEKSAEKPSVSPGQVWTIFKQNHDSESIGTIVVIFRTNEDKVQIYPTFDDSKYDRTIDVHLKESELDFDSDFYVLIDSLVFLDKDAFNNARFLGRMNQKGFEALINARKKFYELSDMAANLQFIESKRDLTDDELGNALEKGIFDLMPSGVPAEEYLTFKNEVISALPIQDGGSRSIKSDKSKSEKVLSQSLDRIDEILELKADLAKTPISRRKAKIIKNKAKKNKILLPVLRKFAEAIVETSSDREDYKLAYGILHNIIQMAPDDHEIALLYIFSAKLGSDETIKLDINEENPAVKLILEQDSENRIADLELSDGLKDFLKFKELTGQVQNAESESKTAKRSKKANNS